MSKIEIVISKVAPVKSIASHAIHVNVSITGDRSETIRILAAALKSNPDLVVLLKAGLEYSSNIDVRSNICNN